MSKDIKKVIFIYIILFVLGLIFVYFKTKSSFFSYEEKLINNNAYIISNIVEKYPELESEIVNILLKEKNYNLNTLKKYGLADTDIVDDYLLKEKNEIIFKNIIFYFLFMSVIAIIFTIYVKCQNNKIKDVNKYVVDILNNKDSFNIRDYSEDEISKLKNDIYKLTVLLKEEKEISIKDKKALEVVLSDISHQIKTPLTSMYVINDLLYKDKLDSKTKKDFLNKNRVQLERIEWLVTSLLKLSRLNSGVVNLKLEKVNVFDLINKASEPLIIPIELKNQKLIIEESNMLINVDINWTREAILNIIKNAHEHTPINGTIKISFKENPIYKEISISDNGEGINEDNIHHIFERFYKSGSKESIGVGLNMAKTIIEKENGLIFVESKINVGTTFMIRFYK